MYFLPPPIVVAGAGGRSVGQGREEDESLIFSPGGGQRQGEATSEIGRGSFSFVLFAPHCPGSKEEMGREAHPKALQTEKKAGDGRRPYFLVHAGPQKSNGAFFSSSFRNVGLGLPLLLPFRLFHVFAVLFLLILPPLFASYANRLSKRGINMHAVLTTRMVAHCYKSNTRFGGLPFRSPPRLFSWECPANGLFTSVTQN